MVKCSSNCIYQVTACCPCEGLEAELYDILWDSTAISCVKTQSEYENFNYKRGHFSKAKNSFSDMGITDGRLYSLSLFWKGFDMGGYLKVFSKCI